jgi:hypothetical protein
MMIDCIYYIEGETVSVPQVESSFWTSVLILTTVFWYTCN